MNASDDPFEMRLRRALQEEAEMVDPAGDGLQKIRQRTDQRARRPWWRLVVLVATAAVAVGLVVGGVVGALRGDGDVQVAVPAPTPTTTPTATVTSAPTTSESPSTATPPSEPTGGAAPATVPVYYLSDVAGELRLYREFHAADTSAGAAEAAIEEMLHAAPRDPDYRSVWPADTQLLDYAVEGDTATVDLSGEALDASAGAQAEERSVQQLVYTVTAADPGVTQVRLLVEGKEVDDLWGHGAVGTQPISRAPLLDVQGLIWIIDPAEGSVNDSPVTARVFGTAFEGNVVLKVFRGASEVESTFVTTAMGSFAEASTEIALPAGSYTIHAYDENAEKGTLIERDSKRFTVR